MRAKLQAVLPFEPAPPPSTDQLHAKGRTHFHKDFLPRFRAALDRLTHKECAVLFDSSPSNISNALDHQDRKRPALEWLVHVLVAAPEATKLELLAELCRIGGYKAPERARERTPEEENRARKRITERLAPGLAELIERELEEES